VERLVTAAAEKRRSFLSPFVVGLGIWVGFPTAIAYQDMTSLVSGLAGGTRWNAYVEKSVAGSVQAAEMPFAGSDITGSLSGAGVQLPGVGEVSFKNKSGRAGETPDENRVMRADKKDRIVKIAPMAPPKNFSAGSVFERTSFYLLRPTMNSGLKLAFAKPKIKGQEIEIAAAFHLRGEEASEPGVPAMLADLVNNEKADILATAYAPAGPDYAETSPFEALLKEPDPNAGRFIPPVSDGDHAWMKNPLPARVFSKSEQTCLANGIYFEARGESLRGQAAVAQVILNRVRNPAYPGTICGVVYQNSTWRNACQFSFACDGRKDRITEPDRLKIAKFMAMAVTAGKIFLPEVGSSTHYYARYVHPGWARAMEKMTKIGLHIFYRTYGGGWS
jgi:spore germination cell wall hydrolase CwlJ-like protein